MAQSASESGMKACFPAIYRDSHGQADAEIAIDGRELRLKVRGIEFSGLDFDALGPNPGSAPPELAVFALQSGRLVSCEIEFTMPMLVAIGNVTQNCPLQLRIEVPRTEPKVWTWAKAFL